MKKTIVGIVILLCIVGIAFLLFNKKETKMTGMDEFHIFNHQLPNTASMSMDTTGDTIIVKGDPGSIYTSLSVGASLRFNTASSFDNGVLLEGTDYFVVSASEPDRFEISLTRGGAAIDFSALASLSGGEWFTENILGAIANLDGMLDATITIDGEGVPSASLNLVSSITKNQPDFFASQSQGNRYEYQDMWAVEDDTEVEGDTGITFTGADVHASYYLTSLARTWTTMWLKDYASGSFTATLKGQ